MTIDVCQLVLNLLKAASINARPDLPDQPARPVVQVAEAGGPRSGNVNGRLNKQDLQIDVWANSKKETWQLAAQVRDLLITSRNHVADTGEVLVGAQVTMPSYIKDPDFPVGNRPGPRYVMVASVTAHA